MSFAADLDKFRLKFADVSEKVVRASLFDLFSSIILDTPVDKGVLRNGWYVSFEHPSTQVPVRGAPKGTATVNRVKEKLGGFTFEVDNVYFTNNLVYGPPIEFDGHSAKAPEGMVRVNTARWSHIVQNNIRKFS